MKDERRKKESFRNKPNARLLTARFKCAFDVSFFFFLAR